MEEKLISVIIPVYNVEKYLKRCVDSVINQTYKKLEIILIDDGSTDNSGKICDEYAKKDNRIIVIHKENGGVSSARNKGIDIASGEYIGFVDSDDYVELNTYEKCYEIISKYQIDIIKFGVKKKIGKYIKNTKYEISGFIEGEKYKNIIYKLLFVSGNFKNIWSCLIRKDIAKKIRFDQELKFSEDYLFFMNCALNSNSLYITDELLYIYIDNEESATRKYDEEKMKYNIKNKINLFFKMLEIFEEEYIELCYRELCIGIENVCKIFAQYNNYFNYKRILNEIMESCEWKRLIGDQKLFINKEEKNKLINKKFLFFLKYKIYYNIKDVIKYFFKKL